MGAADFAWADDLRRTYFPTQRNHIAAHITLFHHLPPSAKSEILTRLKQICSRSRPAATLTGVMNLGGGVAYRIESPELLDMRQELAEAFHGMLTPQDIATPRLHVTVQNKVTAQEAKALYTQLQAAFHPRPFEINGLVAYWYRGGPWEEIRSYRFAR